MISQGLINNVNDSLCELFNADIESKALRPTWVLFDSYTDVLAKLIGDDLGWLKWYAWDNNFGKSKMKAKASNWKNLKVEKIHSNKFNILSKNANNGLLSPSSFSNSEGNYFYLTL